MVVEEICVSRLDTPDGSVPIGWCGGVCSVDEVLRPDPAQRHDKAK